MFRELHGRSCTGVHLPKYADEGGEDHRVEASLPHFTHLLGRAVHRRRGPRGKGGGFSLSGYLRPPARGLPSSLAQDRDNTEKRMPLFPILPTPESRPEQIYSGRQRARSAGGDKGKYANACDGINMQMPF